MEFKLGARGLRSICEAIMTDLMFTIPSNIPEEKEVKITLEIAKKHFEKSSLSALHAA
jgi:ATP-dependent Clp protease ATP-binding subunit ClpX